MYLSGYIFWSINDARLSILMDDLNDCSRFINCNLKKSRTFPKLDQNKAKSDLGMGGQLMSPKKNIKVVH